jgi:predicted phage-related endonuclease
MVMLPIVGPDPKTPEWEAIRFYDPETKRVVFGASETAAVCGVSKYETPLHIFRRKRRELPPKTPTLAMKRGLRFESAIIEEYREARPACKISAPQPMYFHPEHRFLGATPDALAMDTETGWPVDAKWIGYRRAEEFGLEGTDELPDDILLQAQQQMLVMGNDKQETAVILGGEEFRVYTVHRHDALQQKIITAAKELAERIINNDPPEPHWTHPETPQLIKDLYGVEAKSIHLSSDTALIWSNYQRLKEEIKEKEAAAEQLKARVLVVMGNAAAGILPRGEKAVLRKQITVAAHKRKASTYVRVTEGDADPWLNK